MIRFAKFFVASCIASTAFADARLHRFVLPWNAHETGPADFSSWSDSPAGRLGPVSVDANGHFVAGGKRIRFLGVNLTTESCFPIPEHADIAARRLAMFGVNSVRFHHMDAGWNSIPLLDYPSGSSRALNKEAFARLHHFVGVLQKNGIYSNINLLVSRTFTADDGFPPEIADLSWKDSHILGFFNEHALDLQKEFARLLLTSPGPGGERPFAQNPAVAFVEVLNENGIIQKWLEGVLEQMGAPFREELKTRWNAWLKEKYGSTPRLREAWPGKSEPRGQSLTAKDFLSSESKGWKFVLSRGATGTHHFFHQGNDHRVLQIDLGTSAPDSWEQASLHTEKLTLEPGKLYTVAFNAKAGAPTTFYVNFSDSKNKPGKILRARARQSWSRYQASFRAPENADGVVFTLGGINVPGSYTIADLELWRGGELAGVPSAASLEQGSIPVVPAIATSAPRFSAEVEADWFRFLLDLEHRYWAAMRSYIKDTLGYQGVVFGTIASNSPLTAQSKLDSVDGHSYWTHPKFLSGDWNLRDWIVTPQAMVTSPSTASVTSLALQRVKGRPFTVTEYQHSAPNPYAAEAPVFAAAYGALQDWDGIWFFDYTIPLSKADVSKYEGKISNFFDDSQHPTRFANFLVAAALFRRGDVAPAKTLISGPLSAERDVELLRTVAAPWSMPDASFVGLNRLHSLQHRIALDTAATETTTIPAPNAGRIHVSDTGELRWEVEPQRETLLVSTERTKSATGFIGNRETVLGDITLKLQPTSDNWATVSVISLNDSLFSAAGSRAIVIATARAENTGQKWTDATRSSLGLNWGSAPTVIETVHGELHLPIPASRVTAFSLNDRGQRASPITVAERNGHAIVALGEQSPTLWYELVIAPAQ